MRSVATTVRLVRSKGIGVGPGGTLYIAINEELNSNNQLFEYDEDGAYAVLEVRPCAECHALLCPACSVFQCDCCGDTFCTLHLVVLPDGTDQPLRVCTACAATEEEEVLPIPAQRETRHADPAQVVARCPECLSGQLVCVPFDFGRDEETGYHDAGEGFRCLACGCEGDAGDVLLEVEAPAAAKPMRVASETRTSNPNEFTQTA